MSPLLNVCDCDELRCWEGVTHGLEANGAVACACVCVCVCSNLECLEHKCTYLALEKYRYLFRWGAICHLGGGGGVGVGRVGGVEGGKEGGHPPSPTDQRPVESVNLFNMVWLLRWVQTFSK